MTAYRIIKEVNGNKSVHYEVHFHRKGNNIFMKEWRPFKEQIFQNENKTWWHWEVKKFTTMEEAEELVNKYIVTRSVVKTGEVSDMV
jgi:hypothetical protein